jgi:hypothetical protein
MRGDVALEPQKKRRSSGLDSGFASFARAPE